MSAFSQYIKNSYEELTQKVTWPSWNNLQQSTVIVLAATVIITLIVWLMDFISSGTLNFVYSLFR